MKIGLRVCVNTLEGALKGVPNLLRLFDRYKIRASFYFAVGPDRSGRSFGRRSMQPWHDSSSMLSRLYEALKVPPDMTRHAAQTMRSVAEHGHETGLLGFDRSGWIKQSPFADAIWTEASLQRVVEAYADVLKNTPKRYELARCK
jgi:undecaprenyl phosphate-alpha-L-ara4FN deformylase